MINAKWLSIATVVLASQAPTAYALSDAEEREARLIIRELTNTILHDVTLPDDQMERLTDEYKEYYSEHIEPRFKYLWKLIDSAAIHWVDIDWDNRPELVFWTEGLTPTIWGLNEHMYIVSIDTNDRARIMRKVPLTPAPSRDKARYRYSSFIPTPNKGTDYNAHLRAVVSFGSFGETNIAYTNYEISWFSQQQKLKVTPFRSYFPVAVQPPGGRPQ